jgi:hypothetical protein
MAGQLDRKEPNVQQVAAGNGRFRARPLRFDVLRSDDDDKKGILERS